jgi:hypothetical protein
MRDAVHSLQAFFDSRCLVRFSAHILPPNSIERSVTCVFLIFGTVIFSSILASFTVLMQVP